MAWQHSGSFLPCSMRAGSVWTGHPCREQAASPTSGRAVLFGESVQQASGNQLVSQFNFVLFGESVQHRPVGMPFSGCLWWKGISGCMGCTECACASILPYHVRVHVRSCIGPAPQHEVRAGGFSFCCWHKGRVSLTQWPTGLSFEKILTSGCQTTTYGNDDFTPVVCNDGSKQGWLCWQWWQQGQFVTGLLAKA